MARVEKADRSLTNSLDEVEQAIFLLKMEYEKYFSGLERIEPVRDRDAVRKTLRSFLEQPIRQAGQRFRYQTLKARFQSMELYWNRNLAMLERGTHPKQRFRQELKAKGGVQAPVVDTVAAEQARVLEERQLQMDREDRAFRMVFEKYLEARATCGQSTDLSFDAVRDALRKQVRQIKSTYQVERVKFRVVVEDGRAKVKAVPQQPTP